MILLSKFVSLIIPFHVFLWLPFIAFTTISKVLICLPDRTLNSLGAAGFVLYSFPYDVKEKLHWTELSREGRLYLALLQQWREILLNSAEAKGMKAFKLRGELMENKWKTSV